MILLACGGRRYADYEMLSATLDYYDPTTVIVGQMRGAESLAADWAVAHDVPLHEFVPDWQGHGPVAGRLCNQRMLDEGKPDLVVAFPGGRNTADIVRRAHKAGVEVVAVEVGE